MDKIIFSHAEMDKFASAARTWAILCVICAHVSSEISLLGTFYAQAGTLGVSVFLYISGIYFNVGKYKTIISLLKDKFVKILLPTVMAGILVYSYVTFMNQVNFSVFGLILFICGYKTYLYYCTILLLCMVVLYFLHTKAWLYFFIFINLVSIILTASGVAESLITALHITNYLNVFNWIGFFALGFLVRKYYYQEFIILISKFRIIILLSFLSIFILLIVLDCEYGYFSYLGWIMELFGILFFYSLSSLKYFHGRYTEKSSPYTFPIYLYHMPIIGIVYKLLGSHSVVCVYVLTLSLLILGHYIANWLKLAKVFTFLTGLRNKEPLVQTTMGTASKSEKH